MNQNQQLSLPARETFFALLRSCLWGADRFPFSPPPDTDWDAVYTELKSHAIQNLPVDLLAKADPGNRVRYLEGAAIGLVYWYKVMGVQQKITMQLQAAGIPCAVLKGSAAAITYPQPGGRTMGDIDLIVPPRDLERAAALLLENGCALHSDRNPRHVELRKEGISIELHRHFAVLSETNRARLLDRYLHDALSRGEAASIEGFSFPMLPPLENGLVLLEHINHHIETGLGLRQIIDWMMYVDRVADDRFWREQLEPVAQQVGLKKLALTVTRMCQIYLGLRQDITWCAGADAELCRELMLRTMKQGNFGRKIGKHSAGIVRILCILESCPNLFWLLQKQGCRNWQALKRHAWLKPFAWLYQLIRYIRKALRNPHPLRELLRAFRARNHDYDLLDRLEIVRRNHTLDYEEDRPRS